MSRALVSLILVCFTARADWTGWHPSAWTNYRSNVETVGVYATAHSYVLTNYSGTNATITTNAFLSNIYAASNSSAIVSTFDFVLTQTNGALWTNSITTTNRHAATNLILAPREIMQFDIFRAVQERTKAIGPSNITARFYRSAYETLVASKNIINSGGSLVGSANGSWMSAVSFSNQLSSSPASLSALDTNFAFAFAPANPAANITLAANIPTNFFSQTYYRDIFGTNSTYSRVMTCTYFIVTSSTNTITNTVATCCGGSGTISGTNGQTVSLVCTNANIEAGRTSADYGYKAMQRLLTNLVSVYYQVSETDYSLFQRGGNASYPSRDVQSAEISIGQAYTNIIADSASYNDNGAYTAATSDSGETLAFGQQGTNVYIIYEPDIAASIDVYATVLGPLGGVTTNIFDDYGSGFTYSTNATLWRTFSAGPLYTNENYISATSVVTIAGWAATNTARGFRAVDVVPVGWFYSSFNYK